MLGECERTGKALLVDLLMISFSPNVYQRSASYKICDINILGKNSH